MKFRPRKSQEVEAFQFDGTIAGAEAAKEWLSAHDIENAEVNWQGDKEPVALDVSFQGFITIAEKGCWLYALDGSVGVLSDYVFRSNYEEVIRGS